MARALTVVGFASGSPLSRLALARVARSCQLTAIVAPPPTGLRARIRRRLGAAASDWGCDGVPVVDAAQVARIRPDLVVVASYPARIAPATLAACRYGGLNVHMSLLPRHRGIDPIFWTYWNDDKQAGVTVHWMSERLDAGAIAAQESLDLERGQPSKETYRRLASMGVDLLGDVLDQLASGSSPNRPQAEQDASYESADDIARARVPLAEWPAERVWHVLSGIGDQRSGLVENGTKGPLSHGRARHFTMTSKVEPGRIDVLEDGFELHCRDGLVSVARRE